MSLRRFSKSKSNKVTVLNDMKYNYDLNYNGWKSLSNEAIYDEILQRSIFRDIYRKQRVPPLRMAEFFNNKSAVYTHYNIKIRRTRRGMRNYTKINLSLSDIHELDEDY